MWMGGWRWNAYGRFPSTWKGFQNAFASEISLGKILSAISAFVGTLNSENHPYQRFLDGETSALSSQARAGLDLFQGKAGCSSCHSGELLTYGEFHALGIPENAAISTFRRFFRGFGVSEYASLESDPGLFALTLVEADRGRFRTPSLLETARTAPYMHNGTFTSLEDVVEFYDQGGGDVATKDDALKPLGLTSEEIQAIVAFLESMASPDTPQLPEEQSRTLGDNR